MTYTDGFMLPVPKKNLAAYKRMARVACKIWKDHGAVDYREWIGDHLDFDHCLSFNKLAGCKKNEVPVLAWITYKSRAHRDKVNKAAMADARMHRFMKVKMPFDCRRMAYGGFARLVD